MAELNAVCRRKSECGKINIADLYRTGIFYMEDYES